LGVGILATILVFAIVLVLLLVFFILSLVYPPLRLKIYPHQFTKRFESTVVERHRTNSLRSRGSKLELNLAEPAHDSTRDPSRMVSRSNSQVRLNDVNTIKAQDAAAVRYMEKVGNRASSANLRYEPPQEPAKEDSPVAIEASGSSSTASAAAETPSSHSSSETQ